MEIWNIIAKRVVLKRIVCIFFLLILVSSCGTPKNIAYFQELENLEEVTTSPRIVAKYKPQDIISIVVSAPDPETAIPFNLGTSSVTTNSESSLTSAASSGVSKYLLDSNGMIEFPVIGALKISGLSNAEVKELIKEKLKTYIKNPIVIVQLENFKVTVLGEVSNPGPFTIENERVTIIEALGLAGDLGIQGKRTNITVIREENDKQVIHKVDLTSKDIFNSPVYYLAQNDVVYVEPNKSRARASKNSNWPRILSSSASVLGIIISLIAISK